ETLTEQQLLCFFIVLIVLFYYFIRNFASYCLVINIKDSCNFLLKKEYKSLLDNDEFFSYNLFRQA
ncbi:MAG: hypothetical protein WCQ84_03280, partial [Defluviitoga tunisiensis]